MEVCNSKSIFGIYTRINLDFNLHCIYTIFSRVTVIVKFVPLVAEMHITNGIFQLYFKHDSLFITKYSFKVV